MFGCCWHHAHNELCCEPSASEQTADAGCCHHHPSGSDQQHGQPTKAPCNNPSHCRGLCTYLSVPKTQLDRVELHVPMDFAAIVPATGEAHRAALHYPERTHESAAGPPMRLHLFHQILLI